VIKAVLFDYGGVLGSGSKWSKIYGSASKLYGPDETTAKLGRPQRSLLKLLNILDRFIAGLQHRLPFLVRPVERLLYSNITPGFTFIRNEDVRRLSASLRRSGLTTGILSNVFAVIAAEHKRRGDYDGFDPVLLSSSEGVAKPDVDFYHLALKRLNLLAHEVLFIDDKPANLIPAKHLGMHIVLAKNSEQVVVDVRKTLKAANNLDL
jgi:epoxide hydrolase-like predicted phosphatase